MPAGGRKLFWCQPLTGNDNMQIKEAIILAGGLGTRLQEHIPGLPKCLAPVNGRPFLFYVINYLRSQGIERFIFSLGYKHNLVEEYLSTHFSTLNYVCSVEKEPLGTGGAILAACYKTTHEDVCVVNADTLFKVNLGPAATLHAEKKATCTLLLKPMKNMDRFGVVELNDDYSIKNFREKQLYHEGLINGGVYLLNTQDFCSEELPGKFSFEKDYLETYYATRKIFAHIQDAYFIDIGIPEDYRRAQLQLALPALNLNKVHSEWSLFLDRDGVINYEKENDYIRHWREFRFYEGVKEAMQTIAKKFGKVFIVSNQRGVGKGLMTEEDLASIHHHLKTEVEQAGGRIDKIYYCTATDSLDPFRKPNPGMAFRAKEDFPEIDLSRAIIVGNKPSDMLFGKNAGMYSVFIASTHPEVPFPHPDIDLRFDTLADFAKSL
jgi:D-glycero-alpha-D-manno-heptose 1-phosphate guanylyltransferase